MSNRVVGDRLGGLRLRLRRLPPAPSSLGNGANFRSVNGATGRGSFLTTLHVFLSVSSVVCRTVERLQDGDEPNLELGLTHRHARVVVEV